ncbi:metalloregulator ArsR/SmtB family transcription factor [Actinocorallia sp. B10E7]|uniref:ArsR/SmtB family transcription factor n=1 Tax=Actinocorallia sp. B10E7 TaxID=3153558 RepID=UPI00325CC435
MPDGDDMAKVFKALADTTRRRLLDRLRADNGQTLGALCRDLGMTRQGITQHLALLESAGLIATVRHGREKLHYLNPVPLHEIHRRWIAKFELPDLDALATLKDDLERENRPMDKPRLLYVTYIATTPELLWTALTDPEVTARYWEHRNVSGWAKGDRWEHVRLTDGGVDVVGTILEIDPPRRLSHDWASPADADVPARHSRVTFDLEPVGDAVRLTVTHEDLPADQYEGTAQGWAKVLSSLKSLLETGQPLPFSVLCS